MSDNNLSLEQVEVAKLIPSKTNARKQFKKPELEQLAASIKKHKGVLQPIVIRVHPKKDGCFEIIAGERRFKATVKAKLKTILCRVIEANDVEAVEIQATENFDRENLTPIEEADQWQTLLEVTGLKQEKLADRYKRSQPYVANMLRLRTLPREWRLKVDAGQIPLTFGRHLTSWVEFPQVFKELPQTIKKITDNADPDYQMSPADYNAALAEAIENASVSICDAKFSMTPKIKRELKIRTMPKTLGFKPNVERVFNVELFKEMQQAAIDEDAELNAIAEAEAEDQEPVEKEQGSLTLGTEMKPEPKPAESIPEKSPEEIKANIDHAQSVASRNKSTKAAQADPGLMEPYLNYKLEWIKKTVTNRMNDPEFILSLSQYVLPLESEWRLDEEFLKLHTEEQLMELARSWSFDLKRLKGRKGQNLIDEIMTMDCQLWIQFKSGESPEFAFPPPQLMDCSLSDSEVML